MLFGRHYLTLLKIIYAPVSLELVKCKCILEKVHSQTIIIHPSSLFYDFFCRLSTKFITTDRDGNYLSQVFQMKFVYINEQLTEDIKI